MRSIRIDHGRQAARRVVDTELVFVAITAGWLILYDKRFNIHDPIAARIHQWPAMPFLELVFWAQVRWRPRWHAAGLRRV